MIILLTIIVILLGFLVFPDLMVGLLQLAFGAAVIAGVGFGLFVLFAAMS